MTSSRTSERWTTIAALFVLIFLLLLSLGRPAGAAVATETLLQPTPLVLKDGRIANVSIHVLPFERGDGALARSAAARLQRLTAEIATDCFLTAQVIGHVSSREVADNQTLEAHRLARSRADAVQASLIGGGLPAKSIASVWDWQFLVREPRATLWVFRLIQGEDCDGTPLDDSAAELVAGNERSGRSAPAEAASSSPETRAPDVAEAAPPPQQPTRQPEPARAAPEVAKAEAPPPAPAPSEQTSSLSPVSSAAAAEATPQEAGSKETAPAQRTATSAEGGSARTDRPKVAERATPVDPAADAVPTVTQAISALSPSQPGSAVAAHEDRETTVAAVAPTPATPNAGTGASSAKDEDPERQGKVEWGGDGNVVITFATNSSYFPPGTTRRLRSLLGNMEDGGHYRVQLEVGVSGSDKVVGASTPEEARRYNVWLAERRMNRVREWLDENAEGRQLEVEPAFQQDDSSRRVVVRVVPVT